MGRTQTGAWIETTRRLAASRATDVAPKRVRGLKLFGEGEHSDEADVAPKRVRGLKPDNVIAGFDCDTSHPNGCVD